MRKSSLLLLTLLALSAIGCASNKPVIYSGADGGNRGASEAAIAQCSALAEAAGATPYGNPAGQVATDTARNAATGAAAGAVGGAIAGNAGRGAGIGAASGAAVALVQNLLLPRAPNLAYRAYMERCLRDHGFEVVGWQ